MSLSPQLVAIVSAGLMCAKAGAAVVFFPNQDIPIPINFAGVSVDLETGATSTSLNGLPDGDANFFFGGAELTNDADATASTPSWQPVRANSGNTDIALNLPEGAVVDASGASSNPGSTYHTPAAPVVFGSSGDVTSHFPEFTPGDRGFIGFSLIPNAGGAAVYGWMEVTLQTEASGLEGTIHSWAYESDPGTAIVVGIPEPGAATLALLGLGAAVLRRRRR